MPPQNNNNLFTEVGIILVSIGLIGGGVLLLVLGKIAFADGALMFTLAIGLYGVNTALRAPSATQQAQIGAITQQALNVLPQVVQAAASTPVPAVPPQAQPMPVQQPPQQAPPVYQGAPSVSSLETMPVLPAMPQFSAPLQAVPR